LSDVPLEKKVASNFFGDLRFYPNIPVEKPLFIGLLVGLSSFSFSEFNLKLCLFMFTICPNFDYNFLYKGEGEPSTAFSLLKEDIVSNRLFPKLARC
jgi:hypothetical protein